MAATKLSKKDVSARLAKIPSWSMEHGKLHRVFAFRDFREAFSFMTSVALAAEAMNHHPDWSNSWNKVVIDLMTHSAGGLTKNDFDLAEKIQRTFNS